MKSLLNPIILALLFSWSPLLAQQPVAANGKFAEVNGAKIYYEEYGQGDPLILLHGFGATAGVWKPFIAEYAKKYHVYAWDMRGHGRSTNPDTTMAFLHATAAKDLLALLEKLQLNKVKLIGHSSGGMVALYAASMKPDRFDAIVPVSAQVFYSQAVRDFIEKNAEPSAQYKQFNFEESHGKEKGMHLAQQFYYFRKLYGDPAITPDQLGKIKARTLIVHGDDDFVPVSQAWEMFQNIPHARLWISPNTGHGPQFGPDNQADFIRRTLDFLKGEGW